MILLRRWACRWTPRPCPPGVRLLCSSTTSEETCQWRRPRAHAALFPAMDIATPTVTYPWYWCALINTLRRENSRTMHAAMGDRLSRQRIVCIDRACAPILAVRCLMLLALEKRWQGRAMSTDNASFNDSELRNGRSGKDDVWRRMLGDKD